MEKTKRLSVVTVMAHADNHGTHRYLLGRHRTRGWEFCGGKVEPTETAMAGACREILEETGLVAAGSRDQLEGDGTCVFVSDQPKVYETPDAPEWVVLAYFGSVENGYDQPPKIENPEPDSHSEWRWFTRQELKQLPDLWTHAVAVFELVTMSDLRD